MGKHKGGGQYCGCGRCMIDGMRAAELGDCFEFSDDTATEIVAAIDEIASERDGARTLNFTLVEVLKKHESLFETLLTMDRRCDCDHDVGMAPCLDCAIYDLAHDLRKVIKGGA